MAIHPQRYSQVSWLWQSDLDEGRRAAWEIEQTDEKVSCWPVSRYEQGCSTSAFLIIHAIRGNGNDGGVIKLACSEMPRYDWYARASLEVPAQSGRKRGHRIDMDWWREEDGA